MYMYMYVPTEVLPTSKIHTIFLMYFNSIQVSANFSISPKVKRLDHKVDNI